MLDTPDAPLSNRAVHVRTMVTDAMRFPESCDGGDVGSPDAPSIWLFGLEPGWSAQDEANEQNDESSCVEDLEAYSVELQLRWRFNQWAFKLLAALKGEDPKEYAAFARRERIFERGSKGYLKGNIYPTACNSIGKWLEVHRMETGFQNKTDYQRWMRDNRFPIIRQWAESCRPKLIICLGITHIRDFLDAFGVSDPGERHVFSVNGYTKKVFVTTDGPVTLAILPHLTGGANGLNSYDSIAIAANYIRQRVTQL